MRMCTALLLTTFLLTSTSSQMMQMNINLKSKLDSVGNVYEVYEGIKA